MIVADEAVSWELEAAPMYRPSLADRFRDTYVPTKSELRVLAWLRHYRRTLLGAEQKFGVSHLAIASAIAWEALENVQRRSLRAVGPGKMHIYSNITGALPGFPKRDALPQQIEKAGYLPPRGWDDRIEFMSTAGARSSILLRR